MTISQLKAVMKFHLKNFNDEGVTINDQTVHDDVLDDDEGRVSSKRLYKGFVRWTIIRQDHEDKAWPRRWIDMTVAELAPKLIDEE